MSSKLPSKVSMYLPSASFVIYKYLRNNKEPNLELIRERVTYVCNNLITC